MPVLPKVASLTNMIAEQQANRLMNIHEKLNKALVSQHESAKNRYIREAIAELHSYSLTLDAENKSVEKGKNG